MPVSLLHHVVRSDIFWDVKTEFARLVLYPTTMCWLQRHLFHHFTILAEKMLDKLSAIDSHWRGKQGPSWEKKELSFLSNSLLHNFRQSSSTKLSCPNEDLIPITAPSSHVVLENHVMAMHRPAMLSLLWVTSPGDLGLDGTKLLECFKLGH